LHNNTETHENRGLTDNRDWGVLGLKPMPGKKWRKCANNMPAIRAIANMPWKMLPGNCGLCYLNCAWCKLAISRLNVVERPMSSREITTVSEAKKPMMP